MGGVGPRLRLSRSERAYLPTVGRGIHQTLRRETPGETPGLCCLSGSSKRSRWCGLLFRRKGKAYHADPDYGYYPTANALAYRSLVDGEWIPVRFDEHGFRIPATGQEPADRTGSRLLFLGDSFTHGYGVDLFPRI